MLCRVGCILNGEECRAYFFNEVTQTCEIGTFLEDTVRVSSKFGKHVFAEEGHVPEKRNYKCF